MEIRTVDILRIRHFHYGGKNFIFVKIMKMYFYEIQKQVKKEMMKK